MKMRKHEHTKSKKTQYNNFELFRMRDNLIPVEMLDIKGLVRRLEGPLHSCVKLTLARAESGRRYSILLLRHLPGEFDPHPTLMRDSFVQKFDDYPLGEPFHQPWAGRDEYAWGDGRAH